MSLLKKYSFLFAFFLVSFPIIGVLLGGVWIFLPLIVVFMAIPLVDYWIHDANNPSHSAYHDLLSDKFFKVLPMCYVPTQFVALAICLYLSTSMGLTWYAWLAFGLSVGVITGGIGITVAHELMHKNTFWQQTFSKILLANVCYGHFFIEHIRGHHVNVATPIDPVSARFGETFYRFYPRAVIGSFKSAWHLEQVRLERKGVSLWSQHNNFWWIFLAPLALMALIGATLGAWAVAFFILQSVIAFSTLEVVNYIEHYGLARKQLEDGRYERVSPKHSWNANHWLTNILLFHLQRHSDHHTHAGRPFQVLRHFDESPQLPTGYAGMVVLALIPPLWFKIMNPKVQAYNS